jgi:hypothetical protein
MNVTHEATQSILISETVIRINLKLDFPGFCHRDSKLIYSFIKAEIHVRYVVAQQAAITAPLCPRMQGL